MRYHTETNLENEKSKHNEADVQLEKEKQERGERTASNIRYGQAISEQGFGGQTEGMEGIAQQSRCSLVFDGDFHSYRYVIRRIRINRCEGQRG